MEIERDGYASLPDCEAVLIVERACYAAIRGTQMDGARNRAELSGAADALVLADFGLRCGLDDLYAGMSLV